LQRRAANAAGRTRRAAKLHRKLQCIDICHALSYRAFSTLLFSFLLSLSLSLSLSLHFFNTCFRRSYAAFPFATRDPRELFDDPTTNEISDKKDAN